MATATAELTQLAADTTSRAVTMSLHTVQGGTVTSPGGEPAGPYARQAPVWGTPANGVMAGVATFQVPSGVTIYSACLRNSAGTVLHFQTFSTPITTEGIDVEITWTLTVTQG